MTTPKTLRIDDVEYVRADEVNQPAVPLDGKPYVIIRSDRAGVFAGYLASYDDAVSTSVLDRCIRLWRWTGCSLSQVANDGVAGTGENKFTMPVDGHKIHGVIETIPCTEKARIAIQAVKTWKL